MTKTTTERIEEILKDLLPNEEIKKALLKLQLEALVIQAQLEQLEKL
jgi:hypothetical protein